MGAKIKKRSKEKTDSLMHANAKQEIYAEINKIKIDRNKKKARTVVVCMGLVSERDKRKAFIDRKKAYKRDSAALANILTLSK